MAFTMTFDRNILRQALQDEATLFYCIQRFQQEIFINQTKIAELKGSLIKVIKI